MKPSAAPSATPSISPSAFPPSTVTAPGQPSPAKRTVPSTNPTAMLAQVTPSTDSQPNSKLDASSETMRKPHNTGKRKFFVEKLYEILNNSSYQSVISWTDDGATFTVKDCQYFATEILPRYFNTQNIKSFKKQLNAYNFSTIDSSTDKLKMGHPYFKKGSESTAKEVKRGRKYRHTLPPLANPSTRQPKEDSKRTCARKIENPKPHKNERLKNNGSKTDNGIQANSAVESKILTAPASQEILALVQHPLNELLQQDHVGTTMTRESLPAIVMQGLNKDDVAFAEDLLSDENDKFCVIEQNCVNELNTEGRNSASDPVDLALEPIDDGFDKIHFDEQDQGYWKRLPDSYFMI